MSDPTMFGHKQETREKAEGTLMPASTSEAEPNTVLNTARNTAPPAALVEALIDTPIALGESAETLILAAEADAEAEAEAEAQAANPGWTSKIVLPLILIAGLVGTSIIFYSLRMAVEVLHSASWLAEVVALLCIVFVIGIAAYLRHLQQLAEQVIALRQRNTAVEASMVEHSAQLEARFQEVSDAEISGMLSVAMQSEKISSAAQMVAGMAHEIDAPIVSVSANLKTIADSNAQVLAIIEQQDKLMQAVPYWGTMLPDARQDWYNDAIKSGKNLHEFCRHSTAKETGKLVDTSIVELQRIAKIVSDIALLHKDFNHVDRSQTDGTDIRQAVDSMPIAAQHITQHINQQAALTVKQ